MSNTTTSATTSATTAQRGRPRHLDEVKRREIIALVTAGCSVADAARYVGCAASTIHRERHQNEPFEKSLRQAQLDAQLEPLRAMRIAASTHWRAAAWMLERTCPDRFARRPANEFRKQKAQALISQIHAAIDDEVLTPSQNFRLKKRATAAIESAVRPSSNFSPISGQLPPPSPIPSSPPASNLAPDSQSAPFAPTVPQPPTAPVPDKRPATPTPSPTLMPPEIDVPPEIEIPDFCNTPDWNVSAFLADFVHPPEQIPNLFATKNLLPPEKQ